MEIDGKTYLSREEFFKEKGTPRFEVMPLDVNLARAQFELQKRIRQDLTEKQSCEEGFEMKSPILQLSMVTIQCHKVRGTDDIFDLVMRVADKEHQHVALAWITMGDINRIEQEIVSNQFFMKCKLWLAWFDYAIKTYPTEKGLLYYWTEWQKAPPDKNWYAHDVDVYGISSRQSHELLCGLRCRAEHQQERDNLFRSNAVIRVQYPGAPGREDEFECMSMELRCYERGQIDLVGYIWFLQFDFTRKTTRIIIHSFDSIDNCLTWLGRKQATYEDCCLRMGELLMCGESY
ncbi:hypothetical protein [uncultured Prevotella sp.]|uniref:hypothetical protein n=1 Tax=uncultured Prevotella sp. TaxID=159272 RepID=UPI0025F96F46|nr:hypothetical protein [uncultured Prevotella sp.]